MNDLFDYEKLQERLFKKLKSYEEVALMTPDQRLEYELDLAIERDMLSALAAKYEDGQADGLEKGRAEGREEGKVEGLDEGKRIVAKNLKEQGLDISFIAQCTGLTEEEINQV